MSLFGGVFFFCSYFFFFRILKCWLRISVELQYNLSSINLAFTIHQKKLLIVKEDTNWLLILVHWESESLSITGCFPVITLKWCIFVSDLFCETSVQFTSHLHSMLHAFFFNSFDLQAAEGLEMGHHLQPWHIHTDICHYCKQMIGEVDHLSQEDHSSQRTCLTLDCFEACQ